MFNFIKNEKKGKKSANPVSGVRSENVRDNEAPGGTKSLYNEADVYKGELPLGWQTMDIREALIKDLHGAVALLRLLRDNPQVLDAAVDAMEKARKQVIEDARRQAEADAEAEKLKQA